MAIQNVGQVNLIDFTPHRLRNELNESLFNNVFNQYFSKDSSIPLYGVIGKSFETYTRVPEINTEREINDLITVFSFDVGLQKALFTPQDLINRAHSLGVSTDDSQWCNATFNTFAPPINNHKFSNFFEYYWVANALKNVPSITYNPDNLPEYYVVAKPALDDLTKMNVVTVSPSAIVLTGTGYVDQTWTMTFTSDVDFDIVASGEGLDSGFITQSYTLTSNSEFIEFYNNSDVLLSFYVNREEIFSDEGVSLGYQSFTAGDQFVITAPFLKNTPTAIFTGSIGVKGTITNIKSLSIYQVVGARRVNYGDRVLVRQNGTSVNGIYIVTEGAWSRAPDFDIGTGLNNSLVFVKYGFYKNKIYKSNGVAGSCSFPLYASDTVSNTSDWQETNYWVHKDDIDFSVYEESLLVKANRCIIEYDSKLQLNSFVNNGVPSDSGTAYKQTKSELNQIPLFDMFFYDGTHSSKVSSIFSYVSDSSADIDFALQKRVKKSLETSNDFIFNTNTLDEGKQLFFKNNNVLKSCWKEGYSTATVTSTTFTGSGNGTAVLSSLDTLLPVSNWTITTITPTTFSLTSDVLENSIALTTGINITDYFSATIAVGSTPFEIGDTFIIKIDNKDIAVTGYLVNNEFKIGDGDLKLPLLFSDNVKNVTEQELLEGQIYSHIQAQLNNSHESVIKTWNDRTSLLFSLLMQNGISISSLIDFANQQYDAAINSIVELFCNNFVTICREKDYADSASLYNYIVPQYSALKQINSIYYDTTAGIAGFPITLPMMGFIPRVTPALIDSHELRSQFIQHHDGHLSQPYALISALTERLFSTSTTITASNGEVYPLVSFSSFMPTVRFKGALWVSTSTGETVLKIFDVASESTIAPTARYINDFWYNLESETLYKWNGTSWLISTDFASAWKLYDPSTVLNEIVILVEQKLYDSVDDNMIPEFSEIDVNTFHYDELQQEFFNWAASNGYSPLASDYSDTDAFTWNYSQSTVPGLSTTPARWYNVYYEYFDTISGVYPTSRPDLEPWKLANHATKPSGWDASYKSAVQLADIDSLPYTSINLVRYFTTPQNTTVNGLFTLDDVSISSGDLVLLTNETVTTKNGLWSASSGAWTLIATGVDQIFLVTEGTKYTGSKWQCTAVNTFVQARIWTFQMWIDILAIHPSMQICVNRYNDELLPPYSDDVDALLNVIPNGADYNYAFGEESIVETVWKKTSSFNYNAFKVLMKYDPIRFLNNYWGIQYVTVDDIQYDSASMSLPSQRNLLLHGSDIDSANRTSYITVNSSVGSTTTNTTTVYKFKMVLLQNNVQYFAVYVDDVYEITIAVNDSVLITGTNGFNITATITDNGMPFRLFDTIVVTAELSVNTVTFSEASKALFNGLNQTFNNLLRSSSIKGGQQASAFNDFEVSMGYRFGGLVDTNQIELATTEIPLATTNYAISLKKNEKAKDLWLQSFRIVVSGLGDRLVEGDRFIPYTDGSNWSFTIENYNARNTTISYDILDTDGPYYTFTALSSATTSQEWRKYNVPINTATVSLPITITGLENVVNFIFGYESYIKRNGWDFNIDNKVIDIETGRTRDWQLSIEQFLDNLYKGADVGNGFVVNPFIDRVSVYSETGILSEFKDISLFDTVSYPAVFDMVGAKIPVSDLTIVRNGGSALIISNTPIFSIHAEISEYEHLIVFNDYIDSSNNTGMLFNEFTGSKINTIIMQGRKQISNNLRPSFDGFFINANKVSPNIMNSVDRIGKYYTEEICNLSETYAKHALSLLGYSNPQYLENLNLTPTTKFNFWKGLMQLKGTTSSITAMTNNQNISDAQIDEFWAYKIAEYGDARININPELKINLSDTLFAFSKYQFNAISTVPTFVQVDYNNEAQWFDIKDLGAFTNFTRKRAGLFSKSVADDEIVSIPFVADYFEITGSAAFTALNANTLKITAGGTLSITGYSPDINKHSPLKLFNYVDAEHILDIPYWDPINSIHTPEAVEYIDTISLINPAKYNTYDINNANYDPLRAWNSSEVGKVWWDTSNLFYIPYNDDIIFTNIDDRLNRWGKLADYASVDVCEWVESPVPPSEYSIINGEVHDKQTFNRSRVWNNRPIAWSKAGVADFAAHPSFNSSFMDNLYLSTDGLASLEYGTFADLGITTGMHFGAWQQDNSAIRPLSEYSFDSATSLLLLDDTAFEVFSTTYSGLSGTINITVDSHSKYFGQLIIAVFSLTSVQQTNTAGVPIDAWDVSAILRISTEDPTVYEEQVVVTGVGTLTTSATFSVLPNTTFATKFTDFGITLTFVSETTGTFALAVLPRLLTDALSTRVKLKDAMVISQICALSDPDNLVALSTSYANDTLDPINVTNHGVGWRAWSIPTSTELLADTQYPNSIWYPYKGEFVTMTNTTYAYIKDAIDGNLSITLANGDTFDYFKTSWSDWTKSLSQKKSTVASVTGNVVLTFADEIDTNRLTVYKNGISQLSTTYTADRFNVTVPAIIGDYIVAIVSSYQPTVNELAFNPDVTDDLSIQKQYKIDYPYSVLNTRDPITNLFNPKYYFWVKQKSSAIKNKNISVKTIQNRIITGPECYLTILNPVMDGFDSMVIFGLNYLVTADNKFKLRLLNDATLRDDPEGLDLKDTHEEWTLIRANQKKKIPYELWQKLTDSICGVDVAGNPVPALNLVTYDLRNNTNTKYGIELNQALADKDLLISTVKFTILNTKVVDDYTLTTLFIEALDFTNSDNWFSTPESVRATMSTIWDKATYSQINEIFFAALDDAVASNTQLSGLFKTSRLSLHSVKHINIA